jgi:hypothetical protein
MRWIVAGFCVAAVAGGAVQAQPAYQQPAYQQPPSQQQPYRQQPSYREPDINAKLIRLHEDLRLSANQEPAWHDYAAAVAPDPQTLARHRATTQLLPQVPTPRRIALIEATMAQDAVDFRRQGVAVNAFYGQLSAEQQRIFDRDTLPSGVDTPQTQ